jgi:hypothetical protein
VRCNEQSFCYDPHHTLLALDARKSEEARDANDERTRAQRSKTIVANHREFMSNANGAKR